MRNPLVTFAHRQIWRRLPRGVRRAVLLRGSAIAAPRPTPNAKAAAPIIVVGALTSASGLGEGARTCHDALKAAGLQVFGIDVGSTLLYGRDHPDFTFADGRHLEGPGTLFLHVGSPLVPLVLLRIGKGVVAQKRIIAHWVWELPEVPRDWEVGVPFVHEIWAPSRFAAKALSTITGARPVSVLSHSLAPQVSWPRLKSPGEDKPFTALVIFNVASSFERKNPCAAIRAFRQAFGDDPNTRLIVKYVNASAYPPAERLMRDAAQNATNVMFLSETLDPAGMDALYAKADVVMSLHRSEGFGLVIAEGMLRGLPVIATGWSGNEDFLTPQTGFPVGYTLVPARDPQDTYDHPGMCWAEANTDEAAAALATLRQNPDMRARLGEAASLRASQLFSPNAYGEKVKEFLFPE